MSAPAFTSALASGTWTEFGHSWVSVPQCRNTMTVSLSFRAACTAETSSPSW